MHGTPEKDKPYRFVAVLLFPFAYQSVTVRTDDKKKTLRKLRPSRDIFRLTNLHEQVPLQFLSLDPKNTLIKYTRVTSHFKAFVQ